MRATARRDVARYRLVTTGEQLDELEPTWRRLWERTPAPPPMLEWEWMRQWWRLRHRCGSLLVVVATTPAGSPIGIAPLYLHRRESGLAGILRTVRLIGTGEQEGEEIYASHACWLAAKADTHATSQAVAMALRDHRGWDRLLLSNTVAEAGLAAELGEALGSHVAAFRTEPGISYRARVQPAEAYIAAKQRRAHRKELRRVWRIGNQAGVRWIRAQEVHTALEMFGHLCEMHQRQWIARGEAGACAHPAFRAFHEAVIPRYAAEGRLWVVGLRDAQGDWLALHYHVQAGETLYAYLAAVDPVAGRALSAGKLILLHVLEAAAGAGLVNFDLLGGSHEYKARFASGTVALHSIEAIADRVTTRAWNGLRDIRRRISGGLQRSVVNRRRA